MGYPGGKNGSGVYQKIINEQPPHDVYIEAFVGGASVLRAKRPAVCTIAIDVDRIPLESLPDGVTIMCGDAISILPAVTAEYVDAGQSVLVYADPPYLFETRKSKYPIYAHEFGTIGQHRDLLRCLRSLNCMVQVSGYWSSLYAEMLQDWRSITFNSQTRAGVAREWLWMNYPEPVELHDYRYLGGDYREREKLAKRKRRWLARLARMDTTERYMMFDALDQFRSSTAGNGGGS